MPLDLPDGASITKVTLYYLDNEPSANVGITLLQKFIEPGGALGLDDNLAPGAGSSGASAVASSADITPVSPVAVHRRGSVLSCG